MKTIEESWQEFQAAIYPGGMTPEQERQVRSAFMAGAGRMLQEMSQLADLPDDEALKALDALHAEMGDIARGIIEWNLQQIAKRR